MRSISCGRKRRTGTAEHVRQAPEERTAGNVAAGDPDEADVAAGPGGLDRLPHRLARADGLDDRAGAQPVREFLHGREAPVAARLDDVGRAELAGEPLPWRPLLAAAPRKHEQG